MPATIASSTVTIDPGYAVASVDANYPATVNSGDLLLLELCCRQTTPNTPTGFTSLLSGTGSGNAWGVFQRTANGTEGGGTITVSGAADAEIICRIIRVTGHNGVDVSAVGTQDFVANDSSPTVTTTVSDALLIRGLWHQSDGSSITYPSGTTSGAINALRSRFTFAYATEVEASAGATGAATWTSGSNWSQGYTIAIAPASAAATLSSPTSASVTQTGVTIGATTDDATGTLYGVVTTSASAPSATQIKAGQDHTGSAAAGSGSNASLSVGANTIAITGLTAATTYYYYLVQDNGSDSNVVNGTFTTAVAAPTLTSPTAVSIGTTTVTPRVTTDTGNGTCYYVITPQAEGEPSNTQVEAGQNAAGGAPVASGSQVVSASGVITFSEVTGLTAGTAYRISYAHSGTPS